MYEKIKKECLMMLAKSGDRGSSMSPTGGSLVVQLAEKRGGNLAKEASAALWFMTADTVLAWVGIITLICTASFTIGVILETVFQGQLLLFALTGATSSLAVLVALIALGRFVQKRAEGSEDLRRFICDVSSLADWVGFPLFKMSESELRERIRKELIYLAVKVVEAESWEKSARQSPLSDFFLRWSVCKRIEWKEKFDYGYHVCHCLGLADSKRSLFDVARHRIEKSQNR